MTVASAIILLQDYLFNKSRVPQASNFVAGKEFPTQSASSLECIYCCYLYWFILLHFLLLFYSC